MTDSSKRKTLRSLTSFGWLTLLLPLMAKSENSRKQGETKEEHHRKMHHLPDDAPEVVILIHPKMVALDIVGPLTVFNILRCKLYLAWKDLSPIETDLPFTITPTHTFSECPDRPDVLLVPGGTMGTIEFMNDIEVLNFLTRLGKDAKWIAAFCTGTITLAATGLLQGYNATAYWAVKDLLPLMGANPIDKRIVLDRNRLTAAGNTAGIDLGLMLAKKLKGEEEARRIQLIMEYSPQPPFANGTPAEAGEERTAKALSRRQWMDAQIRIQAEIAAKRLTKSK